MPSGLHAGQLAPEAKDIIRDIYFDLGWSGGGATPIAVRIYCPPGMSMRLIGVRHEVVIVYSGTYNVTLKDASGNALIAGFTIADLTAVGTRAAPAITGTEAQCEIHGDGGPAYIEIAAETNGASGMLHFQLTFRPITPSGSQSKAVLS